MITPTVSVLVPTRNRQDVLGRMLRSLKRQTLQPSQIIVVDDGSDPPLRLEFDVTLIRSNLNIGACAARNLGLSRATGRFILGCDDDSELDDPDLIRRALQRAVAFEDCAIVAFEQVDSNGRVGTLLGEPKDAPYETAMFSGCGFLARRDAVEAVGGFEEALGYYYEEPELCMRLVDAGWRVIYDPSLRITHHFDERGRNWRRLNRLISRNALFTIVMRFPWWAVLPACGAQLGKFVLNSRAHGPADLRGAIWATWQVLSHLRLLLLRRTPLRWRSLIKYRRLQKSPTPLHMDIRG